MPKQYSRETVSHALHLLASGLHQAEVARQMGISTTTVSTWKTLHTQGGDERQRLVQFGVASGTDPLTVIGDRINALVLLEHRDESQELRLQQLLQHYQWLAQSPATAADLQQRQLHERKKRGRAGNDLSDLDPDDLPQPPLFAYQLAVLRACEQHRRVFILKSRQIGFTYAVAWLAFVRMLRTGNDQVFISASKRQCDLFRGYLKGFANDLFGRKLKGVEVMEFETAHGLACVRILPSNYLTVQGYSGDLYLDELAHMTDFERLHKYARPIASQKRYRTVMFSTASHKRHGSYKIWAGTDEKGRTRKDNLHRITITIHDAVAQGCTLFDLDELQDEYTAMEWRNLFLCEWLDDQDSFFKLPELQKCQVPERPEWQGGAVLIGYDPAKNRDSASLAAIERTPGGLLPIVYRETLRNKSFKYQGERIRKICTRFNASWLGVDTTGVGAAVWEELRSVPVAKRALNYSSDLKTQLVLTVKRVVEEGRLRYHAEDTELTTAFLSVRQVVTPSGVVSFRADRSSDGHADAFWALSHALHGLPERKKRRVAPRARFAA